MYLAGYLALEQEKVRASVCVREREREKERESARERERERLFAVVVLPPVHVLHSICSTSRGECEGVCVCVCVRVCARERKRDREVGGERERRVAVVVLLPVHIMITY